MGHPPVSMDTPSWPFRSVTCGQYYTRKDPMESSSPRPRVSTRPSPPPVVDGVSTTPTTPMGVTTGVPSQPKVRKTLGSGLGPQ